MQALIELILFLTKVIYVGRNAKDACVSWFHHLKMEGFVGNFSEFAQLFRQNETIYNPLILHILEGWKERTRCQFHQHFNTNFSYKRCFSSFFSVHVTREKLPKQRSYEKFVPKMLMK